MQYETLTNFNQLICKLQSNSLIILDIDDTIITSDEYFGSPKWWDENDEDNILLIWEQKLLDTKYKVSCQSLYDLIKKSKELNCQIIFLTKRNNNIKNKTLIQLKSMNIVDEHDNYIIHHTDNEEKGNHLINILSKNEFLIKQNVYVCDDIISNLFSIKKSLNEKFDNINCYLYLVKITRYNQEEIEFIEY